MKIETEAEFEAALKRLDEIWPGCNTDTTHHAEMRELAAAIEEFEDRFYPPIPEPTPEEAAAFRAEQEKGND